VSPTLGNLLNLLGLLLFLLIDVHYLGLLTLYLFLLLLVISDLLREKDDDDDVCLISYL
jgi:hypothetical protein